MPTAAVTIRRATPADNALLAEIGARAFSDTFAADNTPENMAAYLAASFGPDRQAAELADPRGLFLIAEIEGQTAGYARLREGALPGPLPGAASAQRPMEIVRFYALKEWIGRGVGAALMTACLAEARQRGCGALWLDVWERNPRAIAFYRRWGFADVGTQAFLLGDDRQTDILMQRNLNDTPIDWREHGVRIVRHDQLDPNTAQTPGMTRAAAINQALAGARRLWAGTVSIQPNAKTGPHHHGELESIIYVVSGRARMRWGDRLEYLAEAGPGDFIYVPPFVPHQEINALAGTPLECVVVRSDQEPVVVNLDIAAAETPEPVVWVDASHPRQ